MRIFFHLFERFYCLRFCFKEEYFAVPSGDPARRAIFVDNTNRIFIRHCNSQSNDLLLRFTSQNILLRQFYHYIACEPTEWWSRPPVLPVLLSYTGFWFYPFSVCNIRLLHYWFWMPHPVNIHFPVSAKKGRFESFHQWQPVLSSMSVYHFERFSPVSCCAFNLS